MQRAFGVAIAASALLGFWSCGGDQAGQGPVGVGGAAGGAGLDVDPFKAQADMSEGLVNVSADLTELLEGGALATACEDYAKAPADRRLRLLCGKSMFFYQGYGTSGVPQALVSWLIDSFPEEVGDGFSGFGMIPDPYSAERLPLGMAPGAPLGKDIPTLSFTCASCHFGKLPDGRYAVGAANHDYRYGAQNLALVLVPMLAIPGASPGAHDPKALEVVQPLRDRLAAEPALGTSLLSALLPLASALGGSIPGLSRENEGYYASWESGTMDFFIEPLPYDDRVHTVSKISALWGLPTPEEQAEAGMPHAMLGWTGGTHSLTNFAKEFVYLGGGDGTPWDAEAVGPLVDYIHSLRAPEPPSPASAPDYAAGQRLFQANCVSCHSGPRGSGTQLYEFEEIGTDEAIKRWADPDLDGVPNGGIYFEPGEALTQRIKSPRLVGLWGMQRFLHNGSVTSLESLLCLEPRRGITEYAYADAGHEFGCGLPESDRRSLVAYLRSH